VPRELAVRFKSAARKKGKSTYQALRELAADYAAQSSSGGFASEGYKDRFLLPSASEFKAELKRRMLRRHEKHH
jgi:hypothetical protein